MTDELKPLPCPFCCSDNLEIYCSDNYCYVRCCQCSARGSSIELDPESEAYQLGDSEKEKAQAIKAWNTRVTDDE